MREQFLGAIEQPRTVEILGQFEGRDLALLGRQVGAIEQVLVHPDRAVDLALPAKQVAEREVQVDRLRIDLDDLDERFDGLVGLLVEQEIQAAKIRQRQRPRFPQQMLDVDARRDPAETEEQSRDRQQPPEFEIHECCGLAYRPSTGGDGARCTAWRGRDAGGSVGASAGRCATAPTSSPAVTPTANTTSSSRMSGTSQGTQL